MQSISYPIKHPAPIISVVDDDVWAREGIRDLVASLGYNTLSFSSAEEFVQSGRVADCSCVITDLQMPGLSGLELHAYLLRNGHRMPVIIVTAYPSDKVRLQALDAGTHCFLVKPFDESLLVECLHSALSAATH